MAWLFNAWEPAVCLEVGLASIVFTQRLVYISENFLNKELKYLVCVYVVCAPVQPI